jgi:hypothetical protein
MLMLPTWMYSKDEGGIYVNLFAGSAMKIDRVAGTTVEMVQATDYPWHGKIAITVNPQQSKTFAIRVRVPNRGVSHLYTNTPAIEGVTSLAVNGRAMTPEIVNGYAVVSRTWKKGDRIDLELPLGVQRVRSTGKVAADEGLVALRYGALLYNVEAIDQPITGALAADAKLTTEWRPDLLGGVMVIKGTYTDGTSFMAVPNFARLNRGAPPAPPAPAPAQAAPGAPAPRPPRPPATSVLWLRDV